MRFKMLLVDAVLKGLVVAEGDCSGAFSQAPLNPQRTLGKVWIPGIRSAPTAGDTYSAKVLTSSMEMEQSRVDGFLFHRLEPLEEHIEEKAVRHIDDFLVTGQEQNVERFPKQARDKLNMQDALRWYKTGDEGRLLAMNFRNLETGYSLERSPLLMQEIATASGKETTMHASYQNPSTTKHKTVTLNHKHQTEHESSRPALAKPCSSAIIARTISTA